MYYKINLHVEYSVHHIIYFVRPLCFVYQLHLRCLFFFLAWVVGGLRSAMSCIMIVRRFYLGASLLWSAQVLSSASSFAVSWHSCDCKFALWRWYYLLSLCIVLSKLVVVAVLIFAVRVSRSWSFHGSL